MAMMLRAGYDLPSLRICQLPGTRSEPARVQFDALRGRGPATPVAACTLAELGLPERLDAPWGGSESYERPGTAGGQALSDDDFTLPPAVLAALKQAAADVGMSDVPPVRALWLEIASPRGYLYLVPWERLLAPLGRPILRLPNFLIRPASSAASIQIVLCAPGTGDADADADTVVDLCRGWGKHAEHQVQVHVFTEPAVFRVLRGHPGASSSQVTLHDPYRTPRSRPQDAAAGTITDPWLMHVRDALAGTAVDLVQFVTPGCLLGGQGGIPLLTGARSEERWRRVVGAVEVAGFIGELGAWGLALTGVGARASLPGLRELGDGVSRLVPGVVVVHDHRRGDRLTIGPAVALAMGLGESIDAAMPGVTCWEHPAFVEISDDEADRLLIEPDGHSSLLGSSTREALSHADTPSWVASGTRLIETQQSRWLGDRGPAGLGGEAASLPGDVDAATALASVAALLDRHAAAYLSGGRDK